MLIAVGRDHDRIVAALKVIGADKDVSAVAVVGVFDSEEHAVAARDAGVRAAGGDIDHVVTVQGFADIGPAVTATPLADLQATLANGLYNNVLAAKVFVPLLKKRDGATFTLVSGGLAHAAYHESQWRATVKNAAINAFTLGLAKETEKDAVRVNNICIHFSVGPVEGGESTLDAARRVHTFMARTDDPRGGTHAERKNQLGMPAERTTFSLGQAFVGLSKDASARGRVICLAGWADVDALASKSGLKARV